jgi:glycosyltransferase involved in cell wall biosynthesis
VFLGTLAAHKGPHLVREAWARSGVRRGLRVHGPAGPDPAYVAAVPNDGPLAAAEVPRRLGTARALVLGSIWPENAPLVILEARAAGCPIVAPAVGGIPEFVQDGVDGWLYPPGDVDALADRLRRADHTRLAPRLPPSLRAHLDGLESIYTRHLGPRRD